MDEYPSLSGAQMIELLRELVKEFYVNVNLYQRVVCLVALGSHLIGVLVTGDPKISTRPTYCCVDQHFQCLLTLLVRML